MKLFDLTKNIKMDVNSLQQYRKLQTGLYLLSLVGFVYFTLFFLLFPNQNYFFSFDNNSKNNIELVLKDGSYNPIDNGLVHANQQTLFNVPLDGNFSQMNISFDTDQNLPDDILANLKIRKSFAAFLYPEGDPIGFKDGSLLKSENYYYIVSQGRLRRFQDLNLIRNMGYDETAFVTVDSDELWYNVPGETIASVGEYPDSTLFNINEKYYIFNGGELHQFISRKAFETNFSDFQAIKKNNDLILLKRYRISVDKVGFPDSSLIANPNAVFVVNGNNLLAIGSVEVFAIKGLSWNDVIQASPEEMVFYPNVDRSNIFSATSPHANGTIFNDEKSNNFYLVKNKQKLPILSKNILSSWSRNTPIKISEESLTTYNGCELKRSYWKNNRYSCRINIENLANFLGTDYQIELVSENEVRINYIDINFKKNISKYNLRNTFNSLINQLIKNYGSQR